MYLTAGYSQYDVPTNDEIDVSFPTKLTSFSTSLYQQIVLTAEAAARLAARLETIQRCGLRQSLEGAQTDVAPTRRSTSDHRTAPYGDTH